MQLLFAFTGMILKYHNIYKCLFTVLRYDLTLRNRREMNCNGFLLVSKNFHNVWGLLKQRNKCTQ